MKKRFTFLELFAGLAGLTLAVGKLGSSFVALSPSDELYGDDLSDPDEFARIVRVTESEDVDWTHMAPVCRTMSAARRSDASGQCPSFGHLIIQRVGRRKRLKRTNWRRDASPSPSSR